MKNLSLATLPSLCVRQLRAPSAIAAAVMALAVVAASPAMAALYTGSSSAGSGTINTPGPSNSDSYRSAAPNSVSSSSAVLTGSIDPSASYMHATSNAIGSSSIAAAHAMATASAEANNPPAQGQANAQASASATGSLDDVFDLSAVDYAPGTMVSMTFAVDTHGSFGGNGQALGGGILSQASWSGSAWWRGTTRLGGYGFEQWQQLYQDSTGANNLTGNANFGTSIYTVNVLLGSQSVTLRAETAATASASAFTHSADGASAWAESVFSSNLGNTVGWGGILRLSTLDGTAITNFTAVSSTSGFNYANASSPVPVPSAVWLFGSGLLGLFGVMRRKL